MSLVLRSRKTLKAFAKASKSYLEETAYEITADGLRFAEMDPAHVALFEGLIPRAAFEKYGWEEFQPAHGAPKRTDRYMFTVNAERFLKLFAGEEDYRAEIYDAYREGEPRLGLNFVNGLKIELELPLEEPGGIVSDVPRQIRFDASFTIPRKALSRVLAHVNAVADDIRIETDPKWVQFSSGTTSGDLGGGKAKVRLTEGDADLLSLSSPAPQSATYSLDYLISALKAVESPDVLTCNLSTKKPLRTDFMLDDQGSYIRHFLAPRVSE